MKALTIQDIYVINTRPVGNINLSIVKVVTSEPGLYGLGCATFTYRYKSVTSVVEDYLKPLLIGRNPADIEDLWQLMNVNSYWRNGPVTNNAISGVDMALWDIKGKLAGMPLYELWGGRSRTGAAVYRHADGKSIDEVIERAAKFVADGCQYVRVQFGGYGGNPDNISRPEGSPEGIYYHPQEYMNQTRTLIRAAREKLGDHVQLLHDTHERLAPIEAVRLAKDLEPYRLFFLEDVLSPEQGEWYRMMRSQTTTPIALGELFANPKEVDYLVENRLIDFVRCHISAYGGITPAKKLATVAEAFGIRTAWHGPLDVSPVGHAANVQLDLHLKNFGVQEWSGPDEHEILREMFPGMPVVRNGYAYPSDLPGLGIDIDEALASKFPCETDVTVWTQTRIPDGTMNTP